MPAGRFFRRRASFVLSVAAVRAIMGKNREEARRMDSKKRPLIGITPLYDRERDSYWMLPGYMQGLEAAGAVPVMLPLTADEAALTRAAGVCDGFLFTGGQDVAPALYGQQPRPGMRGRSALRAMLRSRCCCGWRWRRTSRCWGSAGGSSFSMHPLVVRCTRIWKPSTPPRWITT